MTALGFLITFHSPFRVGATYPLDGLDSVVDTADPLPPVHLKGLMRAEARSLLGLPKAGGVGPAVALVDAVFGSPTSPGPWHWSTVTPLSGWRLPELRSRVAIDAHTHSAVKDALVMATNIYTETAQFTVSLMQAGQAPTQHAALLRLSARSVHHLGAWRRRGLGWVGIAPIVEASAADDPDLDWTVVEEHVHGSAQ